MSDMFWLNTARRRVGRAVIYRKLSNFHYFVNIMRVYNKIYPHYIYWYLIFPRKSSNPKFTQIDVYTGIVHRYIYILNDVNSFSIYVWPIYWFILFPTLYLYCERFQVTEPPPLTCWIMCVTIRTKVESYLINFAWYIIYLLAKTHRVKFVCIVAIYIFLK